MTICDKKLNNKRINSKLNTKNMAKELIQNIWNKKEYYASYRKLISYYDDEIYEIVKDKEDSDSMVLQAQVLFNRNGYNITEKTIELCEKAMKLGNDMAMIFMANEYYYEHPRMANATDNAKDKWLDLYKKAEEMGNVSAMYQMALFNHIGEHVEKNDVKAKELYLKAVEIGGFYLRAYNDIGRQLNLTIDELMDAIYKYLKRSGDKMDNYTTKYMFEFICKKDDREPSDLFAWIYGIMNKNNELMKQNEVLEKQNEITEKENFELRHLPHQEIDCEKCGNKIEVEIGVDVGKLKDRFEGYSKAME